MLKESHNQPCWSGFQPSWDSPGCESVTKDGTHLRFCMSCLFCLEGSHRGLHGLLTSYTFNPSFCFKIIFSRGSYLAILSKTATSFYTLDLIYFCSQHLLPSDVFSYIFVYLHPSLKYKLCKQGALFCSSLESQGKDSV